MTVAEPDALQDLLSVQDADRLLDGLRHRRASLPERARLDELESERTLLLIATAEIEEERHELAREQKRLEDEVALLEARIVTETTKLYGGSGGGVKELQALQDELTGLQKRKTFLEDQVLDVMERCEPVDASLQEGAAAAKRLDDDESEVLAALTAAEAELDVEIDEALADRSARVAGVSGELLALYDRIRSDPGRVAVARLVGSTCHGCHLELAAVEVDRLKKLPANELVNCDECGCILVR